MNNRVNIKFTIEFHLFSLDIPDPKLFKVCLISFKVMSMYIVNRCIVNISMLPIDETVVYTEAAPCLSPLYLALPAQCRFLPQVAAVGQMCREKS